MKPDNGSAGFFAATMAAIMLVPIALGAGYVLGDRPSPTDGLVEVTTNVSHGWVVTAGKFKGETTDPAVVLTYPKKDRPPAEFKRITCTVYAVSEQLALSPRAVQVCKAVTVSEAEVKKALAPKGSPVGVPAAA